ncbi:hypothetical protein TNCV_4081851 [Trichonephila clavipes]|nr:hypothetical protein TNCV_4081851 [Trichonephila clavipes]
MQQNALDREDFNTGEVTPGQWSDIDSFEPCIIPGWPHHEKTPQNSPLKSIPNSNYSGKRKENSNFEYPPQRKTARKVILDITDNEELNLSQNKFELPQGAHLNNLENSGPVANGNNPNGSNNSASQNAPQNQLPPPIMLYVEENYKAQMAAITKEFPKIRSRLTGEFLKLYTDSAEERRMAVQLLKRLKFQFYTIKSKAERPIKVVIKGLPRNTNPEEIKQDLELLDTPRKD